MNRVNITIRIATPSDAQTLLNIYAPYVKLTAITFEYEVPSVEEFTARIERTLQKFPYLVAEIDGEAVGYAYAGSFYPRAAYAWAVETSIYVAQNKRGLGIGRALHDSLEQLLKKQGILNLNACIAHPRGKDPYLTTRSAEFHRHLGYRLVGEFEQCGYKFGRWYNMIWMEKHIGEHLAEQPFPKDFPSIRQDIL